MVHVRPEKLVTTSGKFSCPAPGLFSPTFPRSWEAVQRVLVAPPPETDVPPEPFDAPVPVEAAPVFVVVSAVLESSPEVCWPDSDAVFGALAVPWPSLQAVSKIGRAHV